jgi:hypothetical protein
MSQRKAVIDRQAAAMKIEDYGSMELEHLHWCSICGSGLKILDEEQEWIHWKNARFSEPWNSLINTVNLYLLTTPSL